ncbi:MAG: Holliday junction branch migration protein RuvA [Rhodospirillales bacterium]|nr:Holliday junction branch migration protein RuvA [Rhodospirillales bacterium]MCB9973549.1 Holliday junction branch migration protein RuvA [Rhodospirillales bacterium]
MIGKLSGIIDSFHDGHLLLDVGGVGYLIFASSRTLAQIGQTGDPASLLIDTHVREDHIHLYGFQTAEEQRWFRLLTSVQGVGVKAGLAILSVCSPQELSLAIAAQDKASLTRADGVGPKLASRILLELKNKVGAPDLTPRAMQIGSQTQNDPKNDPDVTQDAIQALIGLGYGRGEAYNAVQQARLKANDNSNLQDLIKFSLKELASSD